MNSGRAVQYTIVLLLMVFILAGCGGASAADIAVCEAYQQLVDAWPSDSAEVQAAGSADEVWGAISDAGKALVDASELADTTELKEEGKKVGEIAMDFRDNVMSPNFMPFFSEQLVGGSELSGLCEDIGSPITLP